nr:hypothetical protein [Tanacetum cinerariifolium]
LLVSLLLQWNPKRKPQKKASSTKEIPKGGMDDAGFEVARDDYQPQDTSEPKTRKTLNPDWFKQPPRPPTPDPE